jgi:hypothetical protein
VLRRSRRRWVLLVVIGVVALVGALALFARNWWREHTGTRVAAIVLSVQPDGSGGDTTATVSIQTSGPRPVRRSVVHASSSGYRIGERVSAIEDPFGSRHLTMPGNWGDDFSTPTDVYIGVSLFVVGPCALLLAGMVFVRWRRMRLVLSDEPWIEYHSHVDETSSSLSTFIVTSAGQRPRPLRMTGTIQRSVRHRRISQSPTLQIAGTESGQRVVVRAPDEARMFFGQLGVPGDTSADMSIRDAGIAPGDLDATVGLDHSPVLVYRPDGGDFRILDAAGYQCGETHRERPRTMVVTAADGSPFVRFTQPSAFSTRTFLIETAGQALRLQRAGRHSFDIFDGADPIGRIHVARPHWTIFDDRGDLVTDVVLSRNGEYVLDLRNLANGLAPTFRHVAATFPRFAQIVSPPRQGGGS